tara:strand:- start:415 stop:609 length:195 start_codon:yes stop_codon:yes gene_type:complete
MSKWINIEDSLPKLHLEVIVGNKYDVGTDYLISNVDEKIEWLKHGHDGWICTHWQKLPKPPTYA